MKNIILIILIFTAFICLYEACRKTEIATFNQSNATLINAAKAAFDKDIPKLNAVKA